MNEKNGYQVPSPSASSVFGRLKQLHLSPNGSNGNQGLALSSCPLVNSQQITHYDETSQYFADDGGAPVAGMQAVTVVPDFQGNLHVDPAGSRYMDNFMGSSFKTEFLDDNMLDDCQYQDLEGRAGLSCFGQSENMKNRMRCSISKGIQDLEKLLPRPAKNQGEVIAKSIEYVKHLQLQLKELSQSRLVSETDTDPFVSLKGSSDFHIRPHMFVEQLNDVFAQILEENPAAAMELLESRGLHKVPITLVKTE